MSCGFLEGSSCCASLYWFVVLVFVGFVAFVFVSKQGLKIVLWTRLVMKYIIFFWDYEFYTIISSFLEFLYYDLHISFLKVLLVL